MKHTNNFDFLPQGFNRHFIGFDDLFNRALNSAKAATNEGYPPYNIEKTSDITYVITLAVAGFSEEDIEVKTERGVLEISGKISDDKTEERVYLHKGLAQRPFSRKFSLEENIQVEGASLKNGLLEINLVKIIPEEKKPKLIEIKST